MQLRSDSFVPYAFLDTRLAFGKYDPDSNIALSENKNPHLSWSDVPQGTKSFALLCWDPDVPTAPTYVNKTDCTVPLDFPRADFFHWVVANLPASVTSIAEGAHSGGVTARGKAVGPTPAGGVSGQNSYTQWFAGDADMEGVYGGYDGPCPPFNDERVHGYRFAVYALDVAELDLEEGFSGPDLRAAMEGHVLAKAEIIGLYAINPVARS